MAEPKWLEDLKGNVAGAVREIAKLRRQTKSLKTQLEKARKAAEQAATAVRDAAPEPDAETWRAERKEVRRRVARLTKSLEELV
ncbi:MAG: hypothetical protein OES32_19845 [Acidobacteriota bacterium]|nr:hypothetical protein [Acidobacteriota bacterium]MDH3525831.1 hypothetical protein [Acidobacteriota bacterium]